MEVRSRTSRPPVLGVCVRVISPLLVVFNVLTETSIHLCLIDLHLESWSFS